MNSTQSPLERGTDDRLLALPANGTTVSAEELKVRLVLAADLDGATRIDASGVESVGQAVLQLLVAARSEALRQGQDFSIDHPSRAFAERVAACRLARPLGLAIEEDMI